MLRNCLTIQRVFNRAVSSIHNMAKIGTHDGTFHCDDALACHMLKRLPQFKEAEIIRTRVPDQLNKCDVVVDVGGVFDPEKRRFDHHQREFKETFNSLVPTKKWTTKLSSAGLVYVYYGKDIVKTIMVEVADEKGLDTNVSDETVELVYDSVYEHLIEEIDAVDNGISVCDGETRYIVSTTISKRVGNLNPLWNEESNPEILLQRFYQAMQLVGAELKDRISYFQLAWIPARKLVKQAVEERFTVHSSGEIMLFKAGGMPWREHLFNLEKELKVETPIKYVLYQDHGNKWRIQCVPIAVDSFENRLTLPQTWLGLRDDELSKVSGINDCIFVHANGFIGGNNTYEGALKMVVKSLEMQGNLSDNCKKIKLDA